MDRTWLEKCLKAGEYLYGEFPVSVLRRLYETRGEKITPEEIMEFYDESCMMLCDGEMFTPQIVTEEPMLSTFRKAERKGDPYASLHIDPYELEKLRKGHRGIASEDYWIPEATQIEELVDQGYIRTPQMTALEETIVSHAGDPSVLPALWGGVSTGKIVGMEGIRKISRKTRMKFNHMGEVIDIVVDFINMVNNRERKGWPPDELSRRICSHGSTQASAVRPGSENAAKKMGQAEPERRTMDEDDGNIGGFTTVGPYGERRVVKVGRNEPCPCGSGKKYKHCHGRNV